MDVKELKLIVPQQNSIRDEIRATVDDFIAKQSMSPPVTYDKLVEFANQLINSNGWSYDHYAFTILCCGNAIWRDVVATIPYVRRVLLLPECLKNSQVCKAESDELGLLCKECGACSIADILKEAESLGYVALITEGTTVTTKLIKGGKIDAVIGVGCMESLEKMFSTVTNHGIPALAIPLMGNGCIDTKFDHNWLLKEIQNFDSEEQTELINIEKLRKDIADLFTKTTIANTLGKAKNKTIEITHNVLLAGGNRWRPFLTSLVYNSLANNSSKEITTSLSIGIECFHKASLVHDDIEDGDSERNGTEATHMKYGVPIGINTGDLLIGFGYQIITNSKLNSEQKLNCLQAVSEGHSMLSIGQGEELINKNSNDILDTDQVIEIFKNKTAAAFKTSVLLGAYAANASKKIIQILADFSNHLGTAYQIKDDLQDYTGKTGDLASNNLSILLSILSEELELSKQKIKSLDIPSLIEEYKVIGKTENMLKGYIQKAYSSIEGLENIRLKIALHEILGSIFGKHI